MKLTPTRSLLLASMLLVPIVARPAAIKVNTTCELGNCTTPDAITIGQSVSGTFSYTYTFGNGDAYNIVGSYGATFPGATTISFTPVATYVGASPSVGTDTLSIDLFQNYSSPPVVNGTYTEHFPLVLSANAGPGSSVEGQLSYDGQSIGLIGPFGPGSYDVSQDKTLGGLSGTPLAADLNLTYVFGAGSTSGASAASPASAVPEPVATLPVSLALLAFAGTALRRRMIK